MKYLYSIFSALQYKLMKPRAWNLADEILVACGALFQNAAADQCKTANEPVGVIPPDLLLTIRAARIHSYVCFDFDLVLLDLVLK